MAKFYHILGIAMCVELILFPIGSAIHFYTGISLDKPAPIAGSFTFTGLILILFATFGFLYLILKKGS